MGHIIDNAALRGVSLCFLSVRFKTVTRSVAFLENHTCWHRGTPRCPKILEIAAILENYTCCLPELILQRRKSCSLRDILMHLSSMLGQFSLFPGLLHDNRKLRYLFLETAKIHICYRPKMFPETHSVTVKQLNASTGFASWVIFLTFSSTMGHFPHFLLSHQDTTGVHLKQRDKRCFLRYNPLLFSGPNSKPI